MRYNKYILILIYFILPKTIIIGQSPSTVPWPLEPQNSAHSVAITYGDWCVPSEGLHPGIDIQSPKGTEVKAVKSGFVTDFQERSAGHEGFVIICDATNSSCGWHYGHLINPPRIWRKQQQAGLDIAINNPGEFIGEVADFGNTIGQPFDHLHFAWSKSKLDWQIKEKAPGFANPLLYLSPQPNSEPKIEKVQFFSQNNYGVIGQEFLPNSSGAIAISGKVDIVVKAHTIIKGDNRPGIYKIGYEIEGPDPSTSTDDVPFRVLAEFTGIFPPCNSGLNIF